MGCAGGPVIVVDDDDAVRRSLKFALELEGLDVRLYACGAEVLADAALPASGCFVVDQRMPGMTGFELLARLRERHVSLPCILITAPVTAEIRAAAARQGFARVLEKPLDDGSLIESIQVALKARPAA